MKKIILLITISFVFMACDSENINTNESTNIEAPKYFYGDADMRLNDAMLIAEDLYTEDFQCEEYNAEVMERMETWGPYGTIKLKDDKGTIYICVLYDGIYYLFVCGEVELVPHTDFLYTVWVSRTEGYVEYPILNLN